MSDIPPEVIEWVRSVFAECNSATTEKLSMNPAMQEEWLDHTWIDRMTKFSSAQTVGPGWTVRINAHFVGGMRHFDRWEIADIGVLVHMKLAPGERKSKVALLQSKRLYPSGRPIREESRSDYLTGMARLADPEDDALSIAFATEFNFSSGSRYEAITKDSDQVAVIARYEQEQSLRVYYQLYNPWTVPFTQRIPLAGYEPATGSPALGVRIVPAGKLHAVLTESATRHPSLGELEQLGAVPAFGWRLEDFMCDEVLACREGDQYQDLNDQRIQSLFFRRTGAIAAAIAITIESPTAAAA